MTGEARSRADLGLPGDQQALADAVLDTGKPVVVILMNGRPLAIDRLAARAPAILETWFLGVEAGPAIADVLTGRVDPGGRLPVTFPRASGAVPFPYDRLPSGRPADPDPARDTTRYRDLPITPLFAFGHGLSYTQLHLFRFRGAAAGRWVGPAPAVTVRNGGARAGDEVVQLYAHDPVASVSRPIQELRGFRRVALAPGRGETDQLHASPGPVRDLGCGPLADRAGRDPGHGRQLLGRYPPARSLHDQRLGIWTEPAAAIPTPVREEGAGGEFLP